MLNLLIQNGADVNQGTTLKINDRIVVAESPLIYAVKKSNSVFIHF